MVIKNLRYQAQVSCLEITNAPEVFLYSANCLLKIQVLITKACGKDFEEASDVYLQKLLLSSCNTFWRSTSTTWIFFSIKQSRSFDPQTSNTDIRSGSYSCYCFSILLGCYPIKQKEFKCDYKLNDLSTYTRWPFTFWAMQELGSDGIKIQDTS